MSFNSIAFLLYLPLVILVHWCLPVKARNPFLLLASYYFLCFVNPWFGILVFGVTVVSYLAAVGMRRWPTWRRFILRTALALCIANLAIFKYAGFFIANFAQLLHAVGIPFSEPVLAIMLPVGISFYTFQAMAYVLDVYRGQSEPCVNFLDFALFIVFFPQLVAGPIERANDLLPQVIRIRSLSPELIQRGIFLLAWGGFKKLVIADNTGLVAYKVFALEEPTFFLLWAGVFAFGIQILADFWSYTDMARGSALLLGINLSKNFDHPYLASSPADFWRRWHMSLSYWLRDYVYIPLGGSRTGSPLRNGTNILLTFLLSGLWHGASWNFVLWGGYHGVLVLLDRSVRTLASPFQSPAMKRMWRQLLPLRIGITFILIHIGWLMFREGNLAALIRDFRLVPWAAPSSDNWTAGYLFLLCMLYGLPMFIHGLLARFGWLSRDSQRLGALRIEMLRPVAAALFVLGMLVLQSPQTATFIYFQF